MHVSCVIFFVCCARGCAWPHQSWLCLASPIVAVLGLTHRGCAWPHPSWLCLASPIVAVLGLTNRGCAWFSNGEGTVFTCATDYVFGLPANGFARAADLRAIKLVPHALVQVALVQIRLVSFITGQGMSADHCLFSTSELHTRRASEIAGAKSTPAR
jgi:hypothetical protein